MKNYWSLFSADMKSFFQSPGLPVGLPRSGLLWRLVLISTNCVSEVVNPLLSHSSSSASLAIETVFF